MIRKTSFLGWGSLLVLSLFAGLHLASTPPKKPSKRPKLVIGIVVDQMRYDYLALFWDNFGDGGFKRLMGEGTSFINCHYNYVPTETAPGHASIFTGTTPSGHGIIMNDWIDPEAIAAGKPRTHSSVADSSYPLVGIPPRAVVKGASPLRLTSTTIADQLKAATKGKAKTIGISLKDRSAILPVGKTGDAAYWFDDITGNMVSSKYYPEMKTGLPAWVTAWNARQLPLNYLKDPKGWTLLLPASEYIAPDGPADSLYEGGYEAADRPTFPHHFKIDPANCCEEFKTTAWGNTFLKDFAKEAIIQYKLGGDAITDFLDVSFSATDMVGHQFGPQSREVEDTYLRLDRDLADFLTFLDQQIGKDEVLIFLTADHGGSPNPDFAKAHGEEGGWLEMKDLRQKIRTRLGDKPGQDSLLTAIKVHTVYLNRRLAAARSLDFDSLSRVVAETMTAYPGIEKAYTAREVAAMQAPTGGELLLKNGHHPARSGDVLFLSNYGYLTPTYPEKEPWRHRKGTSHGTHYAYDTHVPLLWWGWTVPIAKQEAAVVIPDIAVTVCEMLGIEGTSGASGRVMGVR